MFSEYILENEACVIPRILQEMYIHIKNIFTSFEKYFSAV